MKRRIVLNLYCFPVDISRSTYDNHHDIDHQCHTRCQDDALSEGEDPAVVGFIPLLLAQMFYLVVIELLAGETVGGIVLVLYERIHL